MEKDIQVKISSNKYFVFLYVLIFYVLTFGIFIFFTHFLTKNLIFWFSGRESISIFALIPGLIIWGFYVVGLTLSTQLDLGLRKGRMELHNFFQVLDEISEKTESYRADEVYIAPNTMLGIYETAGLWSFFGKSERIFVIGIASFESITVEELKVTLAHEFAHFSRKFDHLTIHLFHTILSIQHYSQSIRKLPYRFVIPTYYFVEAFNLFYPFIAFRFSRECEFSADKIAASCYGSNIFKNALIKYSIESVLFENNIYRNIKDFYEKDVIVKNIYKTYRDFKMKVENEKIKNLKEALLQSKASSVKFSIYPSISERIEKVESYNFVNETPDNRPAISIFKFKNRLQKELTRYLNKIILKIEENKKERE